MIEIIHGVIVRMCACAIHRAHGAAWSTLSRCIVKPWKEGITLVISRQFIAQRCETNRKTLEELRLSMYALISTGAYLRCCTRESIDNRAIR